MIHLSLFKNLSKSIFYPLWDIYDRSVKLEELKRLKSSQWDSFETKQEEQLKQLKAISTYALENCPYYKDQGLFPIQSLEDLSHWPILTKDDIRSHTDQIISKKFKKSELVSAKTGGSTGTSLEVFYDVRSQEKKNAMALHCNQWTGWELGDFVGALWGNPPLPETPKEWVRNAFLDRLEFLDTAKMTDDAMHKFLTTLKNKNIQFIFGHSHSIFILAQYVLMNNFKGLNIKGIISTSMMLLPSERKTIEDAFQCQVTDRYGCEEVGLIAAESEKHEGMLINMDHLIVEVLRDDGQPTSVGEEGNIVVTDLVNYGMPLIRYKVGDVGILSNKKCSAGRFVPILEKVVGRTADFLVHENGSLVAGVSLVERTLTAIPGIGQMQIIQEQINQIEVLVVPGKEYGDQTRDALVDEMKVAFGPSVQVDLCEVQNLAQDKNGKYRFAICKVQNRYQEVVH